MVMLMRKIFGRALCLLSLATGLALADAIPTGALSAGSAQTRDQQLREIRDVMRGGRGGFLDVGFN